MVADLIFSRPPYAGGPVNLVFGADDATAPPPVSVHGESVLGGVSSAGAALYDNRNPRRASVGATLRHQPATPARRETAARHQPATPARRETAARHQPATPAGHAADTRWAMPSKAATSRAAPWVLGTAVDAAARTAHERAGLVGHHAADAWALAAPAGLLFALAHERAGTLRAAAPGVWHLAQARQLPRTAPHGAGARRTARMLAPWQRGRPPRPGREVWPPPGPEPRPPRAPNTHLVFACPPWAGGPVNLVFGRVCLPAALVVVPVRKAYMTINSIDLRRVAGNIALPAHAFRMSLDADSWTWSWSATLDRSAEALLHPVAGQPVELEALVNGVPYRLLVGGIGRNTRFPSTRIAVQGRGIASVLASPNAPTTTHSNATQMTAQQLMQQVLTINGVSTGWTIEWALDDWLVPAGAWSVKGTPMDALVDIAGAAGGYIQPHPTDATLRVLHRYPVAPWEWADATPDLELPHDAVEIEDLDWINKPAYNRVYVGGVGAGVFGPVTRAGTGGEGLAPQVTHALITDVAAHRQRGLAILADTGRQLHMSLKLPVLAETGLILPGKLIRYVADQPHVGIVRSVSLDWSSPVMRQTIGVESHAA